MEKNRQKIPMIPARVKNRRVTRPPPAPRPHLDRPSGRWRPPRSGPRRTRTSRRRRRLGPARTTRERTVPSTVPCQTSPRCVPAPGQQRKGGSGGTHLAGADGLVEGEGDGSGGGVAVARDVGEHLPAVHPHLLRGRVQDPLVRLAAGRVRCVSLPLQSSLDPFVGGLTWCRTNQSTSSSATPLRSAASRSTCGTARVANLKTSCPAIATGAYPAPARAAGPAANGLASPSPSPSTGARRSVTHPRTPATSR